MTTVSHGILPSTEIVTLHRPLSRGRGAAADRGVTAPWRLRTGSSEPCSSLSLYHRKTTIAADAAEAGDTDNAYNKTLTRASGAGLLFNQVVWRMSHAVVSGSSDAVLSVLRRL